MEENENKSAKENEVTTSSAQKLPVAESNPPHSMVNDELDKADILRQQLQRLESESRKMQNEFNTQRAKMKELFLQKELEYAKSQQECKALQSELDEIKSQFVVADLKSENEMRLKEMKAQEEISSLQQMVQDTIEETTNYKIELGRIKEEGQRIWQENRELRESMQLHMQQQQQHQSEPTGLAPQVLNQVKKTLARKLGGDSSTSVPVSQDSFDESTRAQSNSGKHYAHEEAEVLRSIVEQLQEEMKVLKEKLREADVQLQANNTTKLAMSNIKSPTIENIALVNSPALHKSTSIDNHVADLPIIAQCDTCHSYEIKLQALLTKGTEDQEQIESLQRNVDYAREDLQKEVALRKDLEDQWQEKREAHKAEVQLLREQVSAHEQQLLELQQKFLEAKDEFVRHLQRVTDERERVNKLLETLQADNDFLSGRYLCTAEEIENQYINLPDTVEELQELMLCQQNELIQARVGSEFEKKKYAISLDELQILRDQLASSNNERRIYKEKVRTEIKSLQDRLSDHMLTLANYETTKNALERKEVELNRQISEFRVENIELQESNEKLGKSNIEYKNKIKNLQEDLATSEQVQKDFVKLSQTLQISLEKLRHADSEVRWQDDEDVANCPTCSIYFTVTVRKFHCRHCGHIYCEKCLSKTVPSGPRKKVARVCDICHTLLTPNKAPYFSQEPLQSS